MYFFDLACLASCGHAHILVRNVPDYADAVPSPLPRPPSAAGRKFGS